MIGISHSGLSKIESGVTENPEKRTLIALAKCLDSNFGEAWLDEYLIESNANPSKKEISGEVTFRELASLKFPGETFKQSEADIKKMAEILDREVERIKREGY